MATIATLLSGGEGVGIGARAAGLRHLWGIEIDDDIARVARSNGFDVLTADILAVDPATLERPDVLHASPECRNASQANSDGGETDADVEIADCIVRYVEVLRPSVFTLENVVPYRRFEAFERIVTALGRAGYFYHFASLNAADFGVPQTRRRLILRAVRGRLVPTLPPARPWCGWYEAIADLVPELPETRLAPWQSKRLPESLAETAYTVTANNMNGMRALLVTGQYGKSSDAVDRPPQVRDGGEPSFTVTASNKGDWRALTAEKVVSMTPAALARFQSFPDRYKLPRNRRLASRIVGNAVPPLMYRELIKVLVC